MTLKNGLYNLLEPIRLPLREAMENISACAQNAGQAADLRKQPLLMLTL
jgi:hypothetical protein